MEASDVGETVPHMEANDGECRTGILIDLGLQSNVEIKVSVTHPQEERIGLKKDGPACNHSETPAEFGVAKCDSSLSSGIRTTTNDINYCLRPNMLAGKNKLHLTGTHIRTPSPSSMNRIKDDASRIVDQLIATPLEAAELSLFDEILSDLDYDSDETTTDSGIPATKKGNIESGKHSDNNFEVNKPVPNMCEDFQTLCVEEIVPKTDVDVIESEEHKISELAGKASEGEKMKTPDQNSIREQGHFVPVSEPRSIAHGTKSGIIRPTIKKSLLVHPKPNRSRFGLSTPANKLLEREEHPKSLLLRTNTTSLTKTMPLSKPSSLGETPNFSKPLRRSNSFQTQRDLKLSAQKKEEKNSSVTTAKKIMTPNIPSNSSLPLRRSNSFQTQRHMKLSALKEKEKNSSVTTTKKIITPPNIPSNSKMTPLRSANAMKPSESKSKRLSFIFPPRVSSAPRDVPTVADKVGMSSFLRKPIVSTSTNLQSNGRLPAPSPLMKSGKVSLPRRQLFDKKTPITPKKL